MRRAAEDLYLERGGLSFDLGKLKPREPGYGERLLATLAAQTELPADAISDLAQRRAQAVRVALSAAGVDPARAEIAAASDVAAKSGQVTTALELHT
jgi:hypothetical protein